MRNFLNYFLAQYPSTQEELIQAIRDFFTSTFNLPSYYFDGFNIISYFFLPIIAGIFFTYLILEKWGIFLDKFINYLLAIAIGFWWVFLGKNALWILLPAIVGLRNYVRYPLVNLIIKVALIGAVVWVIFLLP